MSTLAERIAAEHALHDDPRTQLDEVVGTCGCGVMFVSHLLHAEHVAKETEWAVRAQVAADIRAEMPAPTTRRSGKSARRILHHAARIAEGSAD